MGGFYFFRNSRDLNDVSGAHEIDLSQNGACPFHIFKIIKNEFFGPNKFDSQEDLILNLGNYLFEYNHLRIHGGLNYQSPFDKLKKVTELLS